MAFLFVFVFAQTTGIASAEINDVDPETVFSQTGVVNVRHGWVNVEFDDVFDAIPVVFAEIQTENGGQDVQVDIRNVSTTSFEIRLEEDKGKQKNWLDGWHYYEDVSWFAVDPSQVPGGVGVEVGITNFRQASWSDSSSLSFVESFSSDPRMFFEVQTENGGHTVRADLLALSEGGATLRLEEDPGPDMSGWDTWHTYEDVAYLAIDPVVDLSAYGILTNDVSLDHVWATVCFAEDCGEVYEEVPNVLVSLQSENESDTVRVDIKDVTTSGFTAQLEELTHAGWDNVHAAETVSWLALGALVVVPEPEPEPEPEYDASLYSVALVETSSSGVAPIESILNNEGYSVTRLSRSQVEAGISVDDYDLLVYPGGEDAVTEVMGNSAIQSAVQSFVSDGGGFIGVCGGAIAGAQSMTLLDYYSLSFNMLGVGLGVTAIYDTGWTSYIGGSYNPDLMIVVEHEILGDYVSGDLMTMAYRGGPVFEVSGDAQVLATYTVDFDGSYSASGEGAIVTSEYGEGKTVLFALHPEFLSETNFLLENAAQWVNDGFE